MFRERTKINWEFWIPTIAAGLFVLWKLVIPSCSNIVGSWRSSSWSDTRGHVVVAETYKVSVQQRTETRYRFQYRYEVSGIEYESSRYSFRYADGEARIAVNEFGAGDEIKVYYDPVSPSQSVIDRNSSSWWNYVVLGSMIFIPLVFQLRLRSLRTRS